MHVAQRVLKVCAQRVSPWMKRVFGITRWCDHVFQVKRAVKRVCGAHRIVLDGALARREV